MDDMLEFRNQDGIIQLYFDHTRPRIGKSHAIYLIYYSFFAHEYYSKDPVICTNILTFFHRHGRGHDLAATLDWVEAVLVNRAYLGGTLYYATSETFLFFLYRLLSTAPDVRQRLLPVYRERVAELFGAPGDPLALAMRIIAAASVGLADVVDYERLLTMQDRDGAWRGGWIYKFGATGLLIGNDGVTTALAMQAINAISNL
jgi:hypothetical protein